MNLPFSTRAVTSGNVFTRPGSTLAAAMTHKRFMGAMIILLVVVSVCTWLTVPMQMERSGYFVGVYSRETGSFDVGSDHVGR